MPFLVLIETSGNQSYVFATNKLRENVGASELIYRAGTQWVLEAIAENGGASFWSDDPQRMREKLRQQRTPLRQPGAQGGFEVVTAVSGKALFVTDAKDKAENVIEAVTLRALQEAPGLDVCGAIQEFDDPLKLPQVMVQLHQRFNQIRSTRPQPLARFARLPFVAPCAHSGGAANRPDGGETTSQMCVSKSDQEVRKKWRDRALRMIRSVDESSRELELADQIDDLGADWLAVVHADGSGFGQIILNFEKYCGDDKSAYLQTFREFSLDIDAAAEQAFTEACKLLAKRPHPRRRRKSKSILPVVPLVVGGDDLTVLIDGVYALEFTETYLAAFEDAIAQGPTSSEIAKRAFGVSYLGAGAGVAIVKPQFPFFSAYELASELIKQAKDPVKQRVRTADGDDRPYPCSSLDFHVLFDASFTGLDDLRSQLEQQCDAGGQAIT